MRDEFMKGTKRMFHVSLMELNNSWFSDCSLNGRIEFLRWNSIIIMILLQYSTQKIVLTRRYNLYD